MNAASSPRTHSLDTFIGSASFLWFRILALLQLAGHLEFTIRLLVPAQIAVSLSQKVVWNGIVRIHRQRALQRPNGKLRLAFLFQYFAEQYVRPRRCGVQPNRSLQ